MKFTTLTFNLTNAAIRRETLQGRRYIVAPMAMLTEGVHTGSQGALLYREEHCKRAVPAWNMKPIVVYHPELNGRGVSACDPTILERQQVGMVMNTRWQGKLRAEAWVDEDRAGAVDGRVLNALEENKMMEVSTGLFTDNVGEPGEWNGEEYVAEATNHQPDHLALLPDKIGACSIADGAGLLQLNEAAQAGGVDVARLLAREMDVLRRMVGNVMSHSNISTALSRALREKLKTEDAWVVDVYDGFFIYDKEDDSKLYRLGYTVGKAGDVELTGEPEEVVRVTEYRTAEGVFVGNDERSVKMDKEKIIAALIANAATQWGEDDKEALMKLDEATLAKMEPVAQEDGGEGTPAPEGTPEGEPKGEGTEEPTGEETPAPEGEAPVTMESYIAAAPPEFRDVLTNGLAAHTAAKEELITKITANDNNKFTKEFLATKGLQELRGLVALADNGAKKENDVKPPMFYGAATPTGVPVTNDDVTEEPLVVPTMNFANEEAAAV